MKRLFLICLLGLAALANACGGPSSANSGNETAADALNRGLQAHAAGKLDEATAAYFVTLSKDPKNQFAYYNLGEIAQRQNRLITATVSTASRSISIRRWRARSSTSRSCARASV